MTRTVRSRPRFAPSKIVLLGVVSATIGVGAILVGTASRVAAAEPSAASAGDTDRAAVDPDTVTYEKDVRPIFKTHCFHCHGEAGVAESGLDLRLRRLVVAGGDSGEAIVAGHPDESPLYQYVRDGDMPPAEVPLRPSEAEIETIERWIRQGAIATEPEPDDLDPDQYITQQERQHWAYQPIERPALPEVTDPSAATSPIDHFILARQQAVGLSLSPAAERAQLIRRVTFDLLGLPPTPAEVQAFIEDTRPGAYARLLDRLLASPQYGERWGRHWLDVAGYADSEGYATEDPLRPHAFHYRDYVIAAFNADKPFDQFATEQLAGDELLTPPFENLDAEQTEKLVATGFLRMAPDGTGIKGVDKALASNDVVAKTIEIVSSSMLGMTVGCAQCHNHRYDPITHKDYHSFRALFEPALNPKKWLPPSRRRVSLYTDADRATAAELEVEAKAILAERTKKQNEFIEATFQKQLAKLDSALHEPISAARATPAKERTAEQKQLLKKHPSVNVTAGSLYLYDRAAANELKKMADQAAAVRARKPLEQFVRAVWEPVDQPPAETFVFHRGDHEQPTTLVAPGELGVLAPPGGVPIAVDDPSRPTTGRRLAYARWLTSGKHPLFARVIANRIWLLHFGQGLVPTPADFGTLGVEPTHPELLDWLADEFTANGWSVKHLHRVIMMSATYRQQSGRHAKGQAIDADNRLYWRMPVRRLEAEALRDSVLAVSGDLNLKAGGPAVPVMANKVGQFVIGKENLSAGRPGAVLPMHNEDLRRSVYIQVRRSRPLSVLDPFDMPRMEPNCTVRSASTVSPQSLMLMNSPFVLKASERFARRLRREAGDDVEAQVRLAWQLAYATTPSDRDVQQAVAFVQAQTTHFASLPKPGKAAKSKTPPLQPADEAMTSFCQALLSSNPFLYVD